METRVQLIFLGEVLGGFRLEDVKRSLGELFKLDETGQARLFSGARVVLKRSVDSAEAQRYVARLAKVGARLYIEPSGHAHAPPQDPQTRAQPAPALATPLPTLALPAAAPVPPAPRPAAAPLPAPAAAKPTVSAVGAEEIVCPTCGERQTKRLLCRSCATNMPMGIAAKLEAEQEARAARMDDLRARRGQGPGGGDVSEDAPSAWGLEMSGRMGRLTYATAGNVSAAVLFLALLWLLKQPSVPRGCLFLLALLGTMVLYVRWTVLRLHDCNHTGKWMFLLFVPTLGSLMSLLLYVMPGTRGENDHGGLPRRGSWLFLLLSLGLLVPSTGMLASTVTHFMQEGGLAASGLPFRGGDAAPSASMELTSDEASDAFQTEYAAGARHKAFAVSPDGAWGWHAGAASQDEAIRAAVADCDARRKPYTAPCQPVNVNGH
jgi:uncharacterized membrane protein YhaH (DUF805 family)